MSDQDSTSFIKPRPKKSPFSFKGSEIENAKKEINNKLQKIQRNIYEKQQKKKKIIKQMSKKLQEIAKERKTMANELELMSMEDTTSRVLQPKTRNEDKYMVVADIEDTKKQIRECQEMMKSDKESSVQNELSKIIIKQNKELEQMTKEDELSQRNMQFDKLKKILENRKEAQLKFKEGTNTESKGQSTNPQTVEETSYDDISEITTGYSKIRLDNTELESYLKLVDFLENESINCLQIYQREYEQSLQDIRILDRFERPITDDFESKLIHGVDEYYIYAIYYELIEEVAYSNHRLVLAKYNKYKILFFNIQQYALEKIKKLKHDDTVDDIDVFNVIYAFYYFLYYDKFEKNHLLPLVYYERFNTPKLLPLFKNIHILTSCNEQLETYLSTKRGGKGRKSRRKSHRKTNYRKSRSYRF